MPLRLGLALLFAGMLALMIGVTLWASLERSVFDAGHLFADRWFVATFCDAYCGFVTFYVWVFHRETTVLARLGWFLAIMALGNIAMAVYVLRALGAMGPEETWKHLLLGTAASSTPSGENTP